MKHLCLDGETIVLRRMRALTERDTGRRGVPAVVLDTETTGLDRGADTIIEVGIRPFEFDADTGEILAIRPALVALQDPGKPLSVEIARLTGLTDADLSGKAIDWRAVRALLDAADIVVAHNAAFDRPFVDRAMASATRTGPVKPHVWACSVAQIEWDAPSRSQQVLCAWHGFFCLESHRALSDADALLQLLETSRRMPELYRTAREPSYRLRALGAAFEKKDTLKARGYRWDSQDRCWWTELPNHAAAQDEMQWAADTVYGGRFRGEVEKQEPWQRFR